MSFAYSRTAIASSHLTVTLAKEKGLDKKKCIESKHSLGKDKVEREEGTGQWLSLIFCLGDTHRPT